MSKLLLFPKPQPAPSPAPIHTVEQFITISIGSERYAVRIQAQIERINTRLMDQPSPDFPCGRNLEFRKLVAAPQGDNGNGDRTSGPAEGPTVEADQRTEIRDSAEQHGLTARAPVATVGAHRPNVASRVGKAGKKADQPNKAVTSETPDKGRAD